MISQSSSYLHLLLKNSLLSNKIKICQKLINNTLLVEIPKKNLNLLLEQKYFNNLKIKAYSQNSSKDVVRIPDLCLSVFLMK